MLIVTICYQTYAIRNSNICDAIRKYQNYNIFITFYKTPLINKVISHHTKRQIYYKLDSILLHDFNIGLQIRFQKWYLILKIFLII